MIFLPLRAVIDYPLPLSTHRDYANQLQASGILQVPFYSPMSHAHKIQCPILLAIAKSDNLTPASAALKVVQRAPLAESVRFEGGHYDCYP